MPDRELAAPLERHPDAALARGLPGMGAVLTAERITEAGSLARSRPAGTPASAASIAPVPRHLGRVRSLRRPAGGNKGLECVLRQSAFGSIGHPDSRASYDRKRREGERHHRAVVAPARRRADVLWAVARSGRPFRAGFKTTA